MEEVGKHTLVVSTYQNPDVGMGSDVGIIILAKGPDEKVIASATADIEGRFAFTSENAGFYQVCLKTNRTVGWFDSTKPKQFKFHVSIDVGESAANYRALMKQDHLTELEVEIQKLKDRTKDALQELQYQHDREEAFRDTSESTNTRVMWWSILQTTIMLFSAWWQTRHLKHFFTTKKLV